MVRVLKVGIRILAYKKLHDNVTGLPYVPSIRMDIRPETERVKLNKINDNSHFETGVEPIMA